MTTQLITKIGALLDNETLTDCKTLGKTMANIYATPDMVHPPIKDVADFFIESLIADCTAALKEAALALADAAEQSGLANGYHNPAHTFQVMTNAMELVQINQRQALEKSDTSQHFSDSEIMTVLIAAIAHDLDHDGKTNRDENNVRIPFRLEKLAVAHADAILKQAGVDKAFRDNVAAIIYTTDIGEPNGLKIISKQGADTSGVPVELQRLVEQPRLIALAQILCDADLLSSAGLTMDTLNSGTAGLGIEWGKPLSLEHSIGFLDHVVGDSFQSQAGEIFNPNLNVIRHTVQDALAAHSNLAKRVPASIHGVNPG